MWFTTADPGVLQYSHTSSVIRDNLYHKAPRAQLLVEFATTSASTIAPVQGATVLMALCAALALVIQRSSDLTCYAPETFCRNDSPKLLRWIVCDHIWSFHGHSSVTNCCMVLWNWVWVRIGHPKNFSWSSLMYENCWVLIWIATNKDACTFSRVKIPMAQLMHATGWPPSSWAAKVSWLMINQLIKQLLHQDLYMYIHIMYLHIYIYRLIYLYTSFYTDIDPRELRNHTSPCPAGPALLCLFRVTSQQQC